jgi:hypothetical protein
MRHGDLEIDEDLAAQRWEWRFQVVGAAFLALVVLGALAGLFGHGPASWATDRSEDDRLVVEWPRFARRGGTVTISVTVDAGLATDGRFEVSVDRELAEALGIRRIEPEPDAVEAAGPTIVHVFTQRTPSDDLHATFDLQPSGMWGVGGEIAVGDRRVRIEPFLYP